MTTIATLFMVLVGGPLVSEPPAIPTGPSVFAGPVVQQTEKKPVSMPVVKVAPLTYAKGVEKSRRDFSTLVVLVGNAALPTDIATEFPNATISREANLQPYQDGDVLVSEWTGDAANPVHSLVKKYASNGEVSYPGVEGVILRTGALNRVTALPPGRVLQYPILPNLQTAFGGCPGGRCPTPQSYTVQPSGQFLQYPIFPNAQATFGGCPGGVCPTPRSR